MAENLAPACDGTRAINDRPTGDTRARLATGLPSFQMRRFLDSAAHT